MIKNDDWARIGKEGGRGVFVTCLVHDSGIYVNRIRRVMHT